MEKSALNNDTSQDRFVYTELRKRVENSRNLTFKAIDQSLSEHNREVNTERTTTTLISSVKEGG